MNTTATPARRRQVGTSAAPVIPQQLQKLAAEFFTHNKKKNAENAAAEAARKALFKGMKAAGITAFDMPTIIDGATVTLEAEIETPKREVIDVAALRLLVDPKTFEKIITATGKAVEEHAGVAVRTRCSKTIDGTENVSVSVKK